MGWNRALCVVVTVFSCSGCLVGREPRFVSTHQLRKHAPELRERGRATMEVGDDKNYVVDEQRVVALRDYSPRDLTPRFAVAELVANCQAGARASAAKSPCKLDSIGYALLDLHDDDYYFDWGNLVGWSLAGLATASTGCLIAGDDCGQPWQALSIGTLVTMGVTAAVLVYGLANVE